MEKYFENRRILVTGGCSGIGRGAVVELWRRGASVVALSNQAEALQKLKHEYPSVDIVSVDLRDWDETRKVVDALGVFSGLVNCAGFIHNQSFFDCLPNVFDETMQVNVKAILNITQVVAKKMVENKIKGSIVNISSQASMAALKDHISYCTSKGALDAMTRVMALELGPFNIRVNTINPTVVMTELGRRAWADPEKANAMLSKIPLGRFGEVEDVVNAIVFLLSDSASMIHGVHLPVDGGFLAT
ncbi:D-erythrulose reductase-like [Leptidea sinapis]|uniref:D-erythrulose reductase-like n=1 Tax=Leptidea sinapis TaxID=189913 RepID=UPI00212D248A|nr:D-erythrulose reductase-like [Leptidea sinapis]